MDDLERAAYELVHNFRGGAPALAAVTGMRAGTLQNKADPGMPEAVLNIRELVALTHATGDHQLLHAICRALGLVAIPAGDYSAASDMELLDSYARYHQEIGETAGTIRSALASGRIRREHVDELKRELYEDAAAGFELLSRLEALAR